MNPLPADLLQRHPCFNADACHHFGRLHLPIAAGCNIQCRYCDRRFDCPNESRPGVSSQLLKPREIASYLNSTLKKHPEISVVGIAGPGDPLYDPALTFEVLEKIRATWPDLILCLATNGLNLPDCVDRLAELRVSFLTLTINSLTPATGAQIYDFVCYRNQVFRGQSAAVLLAEQQQEALARLQAKEIWIKINTVVIPGVNDQEIPVLAERLSAFRVDLMNLIPLLPVPGTPLAQISPPPQDRMQQLRRQAGKYIPQMSHCARCRADAVGFLPKVRQCSA